VQNHAVQNEQTDHMLSGRFEPKLLVSVRDAFEARVALSAGCDILDIKEPARGSLGMADIKTIAAVLQTASSLQADLPPVAISAALGEIRDWPAGKLLPRIPNGLSFVKLGPAGLDEHNWTQCWQGVRDRFTANWEGPCSPHWIAVIYADWKAAQAPQPEQIIEAAERFECAGVLFDTHSKGDRTLLDFIPPDQLASLVERIQATGMLAAVAGRLRADLLSSLVAVRPDVLAIRTAGCADGNRNGSLCENRIREFKSAVREAFGETSYPAVRACLDD